MFNITLSNQTEKALKRLDKRLVDRIKDAFSDLKDNPLPVKKRDISKVSGSQDTYRLRISGYRIVYFIAWKNNLIRIIKIEKKKEETYKKIR